MTVELRDTKAETRATRTQTHLRRARAHFWNLFAGQVANKVLRFAAAVLLARFLTPSDFGLFNVGIAISGVLVMASALGLPELGSRAVAANHEAGRELLFGVTIERVLALAVVSACFVIGGLALWPHEPALYVATICMALAMTMTPDWLARGLERMRTVGVATTVGGLFACLGALTAWTTHSAAYSLLAFAVAEAAVGVVCWWGIASAVRPVAFSVRPALTLVREAWPLGIASLITYSYYANVDSVILAAFHGTRDAGIYSAAYRVFLTFNIVPIFVAYAAFPIVTRLHTADPDVSSTTRSTMILRLACYGAAIVGFSELASHRVLTTLFGSEFGAASSTFVVLTVASAWYAVGYAAGYTLIAVHHQRRFVVGSVMAGVVSIALDLLLIPPWGMVGAAIATVVAFALATSIWLELPRPSLAGANVAGLALCGLTASGAIVAAVPEWGVPIGCSTLVAAAAVLLRLASARTPQAL